MLPLAMLGIGVGAQLIGGGIGAWQKFQLADEQNKAADALKVRDTVPAAMREAAEMQRMAQSANAPGYGQALDAMNQGTSGSLRAARETSRGGTLIGALQATLSARNAGQRNLASMNERAQLMARNQYTNTLGQVGQVQRQDQKDYDLSKAALREASIRNRAGAVTDITNTLGSIGGLAGGIGAQQLGNAAGGIGGAADAATAGTATTGIVTPQSIQTENVSSQPYGYYPPYNYADPGHLMNSFQQNNGYYSRRTGRGRY